MLHCSSLLRFLFLLVVFLLLPRLSHAETKPVVVFANPAGQSDAFFGPMRDFMQAAANDLGFELITYYGDRNHVLIDENVKSIFKRSPLPDYLISMNARGSGKTTLDLAEASEVKTVFVNQSFLGDERKSLGKPGEKYKQWLFEYLPDDTHAGYLLAKTLIEKAQDKGLRAKDGYIHVVAIGGLAASSASILREAGLKRAVAEYPDVRLMQASHAEWKRDKARDLAKRFLERYPETTIIWSASDLMGVGISDGIRESGRIPGEDVLIGGVDWANFAMDMVANEEFVTTVGGHFMDGAWALVMLYDQINGVTMLPFSKSHFSAITEENVDVFRNRFGTGNWEQIDFKKFSRHLNPELEEYDFSLDAVLRQFPAH